MGGRSKVDFEAQNAIIKSKGKMTLRAYAKSIGVNAGYLSAVLNGTRPASNKLRVKLGLPPHTVEVYPLPCGHAPSGKRCKVCSPKAQPRRVYDISYKRLRELMQSPYSMS